MNNIEPPTYPETRNPTTQARHKKETFWQITLPLLLGGLLFLGLAVLASLGSGGNVSRWADAALVWLIIPWLIVSLLVIAIHVGLIIVVVKLINGAPLGFYRVYRFLRQIHGWVSQVGDRVVEPVLKSASLRARLHTLRSRATWKGSGRSG